MKTLYQREAFSAFPDSQILVLFLEDLRKDKAGFLLKVADFLGLDHGELLARSKVSYNTGENRSRRRWYRRLLDQSRIWQQVKGRIPRGLKSRIADSALGVRKIDFEKQDWEPALKERFIAGIRDDIHAFLASQGKPADGWKGV